MTITELILFLSILGIIYVYLGYPILIFFIGAVKRKKQSEGQANYPSVSIIIAAYNEESCIAATLENKIALQYPEEYKEILVVSDGSTDETEPLVRQYREQGVRLIVQEKRQGKTAALNRAVSEAKGEIIVFSDANSLYDANVLNRLVQNFVDRNVGYVTGKMIYVGEDGSVVGDGCSAFMKYENFIRERETLAGGSVIGVDGGVDAIRKKLYAPMNADQLPDFVLPLKVIEQGYRVVYEPEALLKEDSLKESPDEYRMRVRVALRALWALYDMKKLLFYPTNLFFSWQLWSHKVLRYLVFVFMIGAFIANMLLWPVSQTYRMLFVLQIIFYIAACLPFAFTPQKRSYWKIINFANYFLLVNTAFLHASFNFLCGRKIVIWTPRKG